MVLTPRAEALKSKVQEAISVASRVFEPGEEFRPSTMKSSLMLSATDYVLLVFGKALDEVVREAAPGLGLRVVPNAVDDAERLRVGDTDLAIGIYGDLPPELKTRPIITDRLVCVVRRDHPGIKKRLTLARFVELDHVQVAPRGTPGGYVDERLAERGMSRRVTRAVPYFQVALEMTAGSDRILTISERLATLLGPRLGLKILDPPLPLEPFALSMVWHPRFDTDPGHRWLREQLIRVTKSMGAMSHQGSRRRLSRSDPTTGAGKRKRRHNS